MGFDFDMEKNKESVEEFRKILAEHKGDRYAILSMLQEAQSRFGYIPEPIVDMMSVEMGVHSAEIYEVATFYAQFTFIPKGRVNISVCTGTACYVKGANNILAEFCNKLGLKPGETSADGSYSIQGVRCIGACGLAPVVQINDDIHGHLTVKDVAKLLEQYKKVSKGDE